MARFTSFREFAGEYRGSYDGRQAQLAISVLGVPGSDRFSVFLSLTDRGMVWRNPPLVHQTFAPRDHVIRDITLESPGQQNLFWPALFIHTWDVDFLSGFSRWQGTDYGMSWRRV